MWDFSDASDLKVARTKTLALLNSHSAPTCGSRLQNTLVVEVEFYQFKCLKTTYNPCNEFTDDTRLE